MDNFIFTEVFNCGKIGKIAVDSFLKYHNGLTVNVIGTKKDLEHIVDDPRVKKIVYGEADPITLGFGHGHRGTAMLWAKLIQTVDEKFISHFDSDVIFRGNIFDQIIEETKEHGLVGPTRCYKKNPNNRNDVRHLDDICQTYCFSFNKELVTKRPYNILAEMCQGTTNPLGHPVIDFFDPVSFDIIKNGGRVFLLDHDDVGGCNIEGSRNNEFKDLNNMETPFKIDFGRKVVHFSAVGSGMNIFNNRNVNIPDGYKKYALDRYALYCKIFYNEDIGIDVDQYKKLLSVKEWF
jgi:hypothetical protein